MDKLKAMEVFLSVSRTTSFTETGVLFAMSATSVSRLITQLEDHLGVKLLMRSTRQVLVTEAGQEYASQIEGILWSINEAHNNITEINTSPKGMLRVYSRMMFGLGVLTPLIPLFKKRYPGIHIELILGERPADLRQQQIDIDFRIAPPVEAGVKRRILFRSERYLVASPRYMENKAEILSLADLKDHDFLCYMLPGETYAYRFMDDSSTEELAIKPSYTSNNGIVLLELARQGEGIALLDDYTVTEDLAKGRLVRVLSQYKVTNTSFEDGVYATILDTPMIPAKIKAFIDFVAEEVSGKKRRFSAYRPMGNKTT